MQSAHVREVASSQARRPYHHTQQTSSMCGRLTDSRESQSQRIARGTLLRNLWHCNRGSESQLGRTARDLQRRSSALLGVAGAALGVEVARQPRAHQSVVVPQVLRAALSPSAAMGVLPELPERREPPPRADQALERRVAGVE